MPKKKTVSKKKVTKGKNSKGKAKKTVSKGNKKKKTTRKNSKTAKRKPSARKKVVRKRKATSKSKTSRKKQKVDSSNKLEENKKVTEELNEKYNEEVEQEIKKDTPVEKEAIMAEPESNLQENTTFELEQPNVDDPIPVPENRTMDAPVDESVMDNKQAQQNQTVEVPAEPEKVSQVESEPVQVETEHSESFVQRCKTAAVKVFQTIVGSPDRHNAGNSNETENVESVDLPMETNNCQPIEQTTENDGTLPTNHCQPIVEQTTENDGTLPENVEPVEVSAEHVEAPVEHVEAPLEHVEAPCNVEEPEKKFPVNESEEFVQQSENTDSHRSEPAVALEDSGDQENTDSHRSEPAVALEDSGDQANISNTDSTSEQGVSNVTESEDSLQTQNYSTNTDSLSEQSVPQVTETEDSVQTQVIETLTDQEAPTVTESDYSQTPADFNDSTNTDSIAEQCVPIMSERDASLRTLPVCEQPTEAITHEEELEMIPEEVAPTIVHEQDEFTPEVEAAAMETEQKVESVVMETEVTTSDTSSNVAINEEERLPVDGEFSNEHVTQETNDFEQTVPEQLEETVPEQPVDPDQWAQPPVETTTHPTSLNHELQTSDNAVNHDYDSNVFDDLSSEMPTGRRRKSSVREEPESPQPCTDEIRHQEERNIQNQIQDASNIINQEVNEKPAVDNRQISGSNGMIEQPIIVPQELEGRSKKNTDRKSDRKSDKKRLTSGSTRSRSRSKNRKRRRSRSDSRSGSSRSYSRSSSRESSRSPRRNRSYSPRRRNTDPSAFRPVRDARGKIKALNERGFGFIRPADDRHDQETIYFHCSSIKNAHFQDVEVGDKVIFSSKWDDRQNKSRAATVEMVDPREPSRNRRYGGDRQGGDRQGGDRQGSDRQGGNRYGGERHGGGRRGGDRDRGDRYGERGSRYGGGDRYGGDRYGGDRYGRRRY